MDKIYSDNEKKLYVMLLEWLLAMMALRHGTRKNDPESLGRRSYSINAPLEIRKIKGDHINHYYSSDWSGTCTILWKAGLIFPYESATPYNEYDEHYPGYFTNHHNIDEVENTVLNGQWNFYENLENVIAEFCECNLYDTNKQRGFSVKARPFLIAPPFIPVFEQLTKCGFTAFKDGSYLWTSKVANAFKKYHIWFYDEYDNQLSAELEAEGNF